MEVDKVGDMVADMFADIVAKRGTYVGKKKKGTQFGKKKKRGTQFGERVGHRGWLIGPKLFRPEPYPTCVSSKLCEFILPCGELLSICVNQLFQSVPCGQFPQ